MIKAENGHIKIGRRIQINKPWRYNRVAGVDGARHPAREIVPGENDVAPPNHHAAMVERPMATMAMPDNPARGDQRAYIS